MLSGEGNENGKKKKNKNRSNQQKRNFARATHFLCTFLCRCFIARLKCEFPEVSSLHVLWRKCRTCSCSCTLFFHRRSFLPRWPLAFLIFSPPLQNFMLFLQQKVCVACYEKNKTKTKTKKKQHLIYETTIYRYSKRHTDTKKSIDIRI